jgi:D-glycero-alpha-D-manno-heptose 1-phosphate guanylyltransferase
MTTAIILAGGLGTRLRAVVPDAPKPMALINGRPFLEHQLDYWIGQGITHAILSVGYKREIITKHFGDRYNGITIDYAIEETPLGTGGGLLLAMDKLPDAKPFLVLNGDTFVEASLKNIKQAHETQDADWTMVTFKADMADRYGGIDMGEDGRITALRAGKAGMGEWGNAGVYMISPALFADFGWSAGDIASLEQDILPQILVDDKRCIGTPCHGVFIDIGLPDDYVRAAKLPAFH